MEFAYSPEQELIRSSIADLAESFDEAYWREVRQTTRFPEAFHEALAEGGWLGILFDKEYGGQGMSMLDFVVVVETLAEHGAWIGATGLVTGTVFGGLSIQVHGTDDQREAYLPGIAAGDRWALGVTEADAGLNTMNITTWAERTHESTDVTRDGDEYVITGGKQWISGIDDAERLLLLTRTSPKDAGESPAEGMTMFVVDPADSAIEYTEIPLDIWFTERTYEVHIDGLRVGEDAILGSEGEGFYQLFDTLNAERVATAGHVWGAGWHALQRAAEYAGERVVWGEPIGAHQSIQHPLADAYADLQTARLAIEKAAWQFDTGADGAGEMANVANLQAAKAAWAACEAATTTFGGSSASADLGIAAAAQFVRHSRIAPVSEQMIRNYLGVHALGLPRSYNAG